MSKGAVLIIGSGGREHALSWKLAQSQRVSRVIAAPGNDGFDPAWERWACDLSKGKPEFERLAREAKKAGVTLAVIGPDNPLADGIVDVFEREGVLTFGPSQAAAQLEASKSFAKEVMSAAGVPTARYQLAHDLDEALEYLQELSWPFEPKHPAWVLKADGLALGKGVVLCSTLAEAQSAARALIGVSGSLVIEEFLPGVEVSWMAICDGSRAALLDPARDHKRLRDRNEGPNTGGMGAYSPVPDAPSWLREAVREKVFAPTLREMQKRGTPFSGILYAGLMVDALSQRFWVLEFNARWGDPETQALVPRIQGDLYDWFEAAALASSRRSSDGLAKFPRDVPFTDSSAVAVVAAAPGYPDAPKKGLEIQGLGSEWDANSVFAAGVKHEGSRWLTSGGRVLATWALGEDLNEARKKAYQRMDSIRFEGMQVRKDIGPQ